MTQPNQPTTPETLDTEQLDAAVGGIIAIVPALADPCSKIAAVTVGNPCNKTPKIAIGVTTTR